MQQSCFDSKNKKEKEPTRKKKERKFGGERDKGKREEGLEYEKKRKMNTFPPEQFKASRFTVNQFLYF